MGICIARQKPANSSQNILETNARMPLRTGVTMKVRKQKQGLPDPRISVDTIEAKYSKVQDKAKTKADANFISGALTKHFIFNSLTEEQRDLVINHMKYYLFDPRQTVFEQDTVGSVFFVVAYGNLEVLVDNKFVKTLHAQDSFGEVALLHDMPRTATVRTIDNTALWGVDRRTFRSTLEQINIQKYSENKSLLETIPVFKILNSAQLESLISSIKSPMFAPTTVIVNEGDTGDLLYIIKQGNVKCSKDGVDIRTMEKGDYFGEQALLYNSVRTATITAIDNVTCLTIDRTELTSLFGTSLQLILHKSTQRIAFEKNAYLKKLRPSQYEGLMNAAEILEKHDGDQIITAGVKKSETIIVLLKGELQTREGKVIYTEFDLIGLDEAIEKTETAFLEDYFAKGDVDIALIKNEAFFNTIGGDYHRVASNNNVIRLLKKIQLFKNLNESQFESLLQVLKVENYGHREIIFSQDQEGDSLFLIKSGKVDVINLEGQVMRSITKDDYFGERSLLFRTNRSATVRANGEVCCWVLYASDFFGILDEKLKNFLIKRIELQDDKINLNHLQIVSSIGKGTYGNIFLVVHKQNKSLYALKCVDKKKVEAFEIEENLILERKIMLQIDHILISKLIKTFTDSKRVYFLLEFIRGNNLFDVLWKLDAVTVADAKFYTACIISMLEHLHERDIVYRDLHPKNIVIDDEGYPKLVDFGSAKCIKGRTYTTMGNPHYMAPEIILGHGYTIAVDYWSAGIMLYEFLYAVVPFGEDENDPYMIYETVQKSKLIFPAESENKDKIWDLLNQLLNKNPAARLGGSFENIKSHPWFIGINWEKILTRELPTPYVPTLPPLAESVANALKSNKSLDEVISRVEKDEIIPKARKKQSRVAKNWDEEFSS